MTELKPPGDWKVEPLGKFFRERREQASDSEYEPLSVSMAGVVPRMDNVAISFNGENRKLVRKDDFVINSRSDRKGSAGVADRDGSVSLISIVLEPCGIEPRFVHHLLRSTWFQEEFYRWGSGIVDDLWSTRFQAMKRIGLPIPPIEQQRRIADYLDRETATIDALIEKQRALVQGLRDRRIATVENMLAGVCSPVPVKWCAELLAGYAFSSSDFVRVEDGRRLLRGINVKPGSIDWSEAVSLSTTAAPSSSEYALHSGDVVLGMDRPFVGGGTRVALVDYCAEGAYLVQRVLRLRPIAGVDCRMLAYALGGTVFRTQIETEFTGISVPHLSESQVSRVKIPMPPADEQREIADHLDHETAKIDALIAKAERFIELAQERRAALITAAVTGQIEIPTED
ncbi:restriction endonuclease subunit S [Micrococcus sp. NPDC078436]|uniref:restriction endonuclease subunit S n=1 Tax=Micrococcus sp. NPDC078436 TaxID=3154960 RepID=UPI00344F6CE8